MDTIPLAITNLLVDIFVIMHSFINSLIIYRGYQKNNYIYHHQSINNILFQFAAILRKAGDRNTQSVALIRYLCFYYDFVILCFRLTPVYMLCVMVYSNFMHYFADGPYETERLKDIDDCDTQWWKNMLYVNNLFIDKPKKVRIKHAPVYLSNSR